MCVPHRVIVASVLMMSISNSASKPQGDIVLPEDDNEFITLLGVGNQCKCVPIDKCLDEPETNLEFDPISGAPIISGIGIINEKGNTLAHIRDIESSNCSSLLEVFCEKEKKPIPTSTPSPPPGNQCGIRNIEGFRVTLVGTDHATQYGEFPWMVAVLTQGDNGYVGGGSLLHPKVVLTAAHKVYDKTDGLIARIGDWDLSNNTREELNPAQTINVKKIVPHPHFSRAKLINNVAILILESNAVLSETVMPICLPEPDQIFDGSQCIVTGWGKNKLGEPGKFQKVLKKVNVPAVNHEDCQSMLRNTDLGPGFNLHSTFNCAGGEGEDSCEGDGGSPLICPSPNNPHEYVQMGVTAWGVGCGIKGNPGVYGSVPKTVNWIKQVIDEEGGTDK